MRLCSAPARVQGPSHAGGRSASGSGEACPRAATSAIDGNFTTVLEHLEAAKREETIFRSALKDLGHPLPAAASP